MKSIGDEPNSTEDIIVVMDVKKIWRIQVQLIMLLALRR